jgi:hypothetical protein
MIGSSTWRAAAKLGALSTALTLFGWAVGAASAAAAIPIGPGPQVHYTVQPQPAPGTCHYRHTAAGQPLQDVHCTPGALNPKVKQTTLATTVCKSGYTTSIRPPTSITDKEKLANARSYRYTGSLSQAEYDHLVPLELGGDPNSARNLWVEPPSPGHTTLQGVSNPKDGVETHLKALVCDYLKPTVRTYLPLARAQLLIDSNWTTASALAPHYLVAKN